MGWSGRDSRREDGRPLPPTGRSRRRVSSRRSLIRLSPPASSRVSQRPLRSRRRRRTAHSTLRVSVTRWRYPRADRFRRLRGVRRACYIGLMTRFFAALCLVAMLGSWAPHVHSSDDGSGHGSLAHGSLAAQHDASSKTTRPFTVSSDDAHEDHSSSASIESPECVVCRSAEERQGDRAATAGLLPLAVLGTRIGTHPEHPLPTELVVGLHPTRAPPLG